MFFPTGEGVPDKALGADGKLFIERVAGLADGVLLLESTSSLIIWPLAPRGRN